MINRRQFLATSAALGLSSIAGRSLAQDAGTYPNKPVRIVVGLAPGASTDTGTRLLAHALADTGGSYIVENRAGAGSTIGAGMVAQSAPDGYTLFMGTGSYATSAVLYKSLSFDPVGAFAPITQVNRFPQAIAVRADSDIGSLKDLIAKAKAAPGSVMYGSTGHGGQTHLTGELFKMLAGVDMTHVPYRGAGPAIIELISGRIPVVFVDLFSLLPHVAKGDLRVLAVTSQKRADLAPDVPTAKEQGIDIDITAWLGLFAPAKTPASVIDTMQAKVAVAARQPALIEKMRQSGAELVASTPAQFNAFFKREVELYTKIAERAKITLE